MTQTVVGQTKETIRGSNPDHKIDADLLVHIVMLAGVAPTAPAASGLG